MVVAGLGLALTGGRRDWLAVVHLLVGAAPGVLFAHATTPRLPVLQTIAATVLTATMAGGLVWLDRTSSIDGFVFVVAVNLAGVATSAGIWKRLESDRSAS